MRFKGKSKKNGQSLNSKIGNNLTIFKSFAKVHIRITSFPFHPKIQFMMNQAKLTTTLGQKSYLKFPKKYSWSNYLG